MANTNVSAVTRIATVALEPFTILRNDPSNSWGAIPCGANQRPSGVSPAYAVAAGVSFQMAINGQAEVTLGSGSGSVSPGDRIKADASALGVPIATSGTVAQNSVGIAVAAGVARDTIFIEIAIDVIDSNLTIS